MGDVPDLPAPSGVDQDAWYAAVAAVRAHCGWHVAPVVTETIKVVVNPPVIVLPSLRVVDVESVAVDGSPVTDFVLQPHPVLWVGCYWRSDRDRPLVADVTLTHGYDDLPADVLAVVTSMASRGPVAPAAPTMVAGPFQVNYGVTSAALSGPVGLLDGQVTVLDRYKLPPRP